MEGWREGDGRGKMGRKKVEREIEKER